VIAFYIKKDKLSASIDFVKKLKENIKHLVDFPYQYKKSIYFNNDEIRDMVYRGYTIIYEIDIEKNTLELLSIFNPLGNNSPTLGS